MHPQNFLTRTCKIIEFVKSTTSHVRVWNRVDVDGSWFISKLGRVLRRISITALLIRTVIQSQSQSYAGVVLTADI